MTFIVSDELAKEASNEMGWGNNENAAAILSNQCEHSYYDVADYNESEEPEYVWVFTGEQAWDGEVADIIVKVFPSEDAAVKYLHDFLLDDGGDESIRQYVERKDWEVEEDGPMLYRALRPGYYTTDHIELTITKCEIKK